MIRTDSWAGARIGSYESVRIMVWPQEGDNAPAPGLRCPSAHLQKRLMTTLAFKDIVKRFGDTTAVDGVSLTVQSGEFCSLVGPSGCGKTTLLRIAAGFVKPDQGIVLLDGRQVDNLPPNRRGVGFVFQSYALFPTKTIEQNIGFSLTLKGRPRREIAERVAQLCDLMDLADFRERYPHELSGGQQQRVALARALAPSPSILLLDEPLSALDAKIRTHLRSEIRGIVDTLRITALYVTHDQEEALSISDRVAVMDKGTIMQVGTPIDVCLHPANPFVAHFVGTSNHIPCRVIDGQTVEIGGASLPMHTDGTPKGAATMSLRPEHVAISPPGNGGVPGVLRAVSFLGPSVRLTLETGQRLKLTVDMPTAAWIEHPLELGAVLAWTAKSHLTTFFPVGKVR
jgi:putative spermidine/putrescine transport system ATP-binding protein